MATAEHTIAIGGTRLTVRGFDDGKPRLMTKVLVEGSRIYGVNAKGEFFASGTRGRHFTTHPNPKNLDTLDAAAKLGLLDKKAIAALRKKHDLINAARSANWATSDLERAAKKLGVSLPDNIKRRIRNVRRTYKRHVKGE